MVRESPPTLIGSIFVGERNRYFRLVWPPEFPLRPPTIWETDGPDGTPIDHSSTGHVYQDSSLCLYAHLAQQGWLPENSAADALDQFRSFCEGANAGEFANAMRRPIEWDTLRVSVPPKIAEALRGGGSWGVLKGLMRIDARMLLITGVDSTVPGRISAGRIDAVPSAPWRLVGGFQTPDGGTFELTGIWCRIRWGGPATSETPRDRDRLLASVRSQISRPQWDYIADAPMVLAVDHETGELSFVFLNPSEPVAALLQARGNPLIVFPTVVEDLREKLFHRIDGRLSGRRLLETVRVAIVGCGSVGGHVALSLARAGVRRFVLFDPEVLEPENVLRHIGGLGQVGLKKVEVVETAIRFSNPDADVVAKPVALSADPSVWSHDAVVALTDVLEDPNGIVVCTAAADEVDRLVNALCVAKGCPAVYAWLMGRAEFGRVFRVFPRETACYVCVVRAQQAHPDRFPRYTTPDTVMERPQYGQSGIPGISIDIEQVALLAARLVLQTIARRLPEPLGYPDAHGDHFLWSNHSAWEALDGPLQARVERIPRDSTCPVCGSLVGTTLEDDEEQELRDLERRTRSPT